MADVFWSSEEFTAQGVRAVFWFSVSSLLSVKCLYFTVYKRERGLGIAFIEQSFIH